MALLPIWPCVIFLGRHANDIMPTLWDISYEMRLTECGLTTLDIRILKGGQKELFRVLNGYENIDRNVLSMLMKND